MLLEARLLDERREAKAEGIADGKAIGLTKGKAGENTALAKLTLAHGCYSPQEITELTGLSLEKLEKLNNEILAAKQA